MTRMLVVSDLHIDFHRDLGQSLVNSLCDKDIDIAIVAGDISESDHVADGLELLCDKYPKVIYINGNHDYYRSDFGQMDTHMRAIENRLSNLIWLDDTRVNINGINFVGATLWFNNSLDAYRNKRYMADFSCIQACDPIAFNKCAATTAFFQTNIKTGDIVITHHLPSYKSVQAKFIGSRLNCYFITDIENIITSTNPALWIHGHTHSNCDYMLGSTRIICNPLGYPGENPQFNESLVITI